MIDYSCNYTSRESNGPMSGVKIQTFRPNPGPSSVNYDPDCTFVCTVHKYLPTYVCMHSVCVCLYFLYLVLVLQHCIFRSALCDNHCLISLVCVDLWVLL